MKDFYLAYKAWRQINIIDPWERARALSYYVIAPHSQKFNTWSDVFKIPGEEIKRTEKATVRKWTEKEKEQYERLTNG